MSINNETCTHAFVCLFVEGLNDWKKIYMKVKFCFSVSRKMRMTWKIVWKASLFQCSVMQPLVSKQSDWMFYRYFNKNTYINLQVQMMSKRTNWVNFLIYGRQRRISSTRVPSPNFSHLHRLCRNTKIRYWVNMLQLLHRLIRPWQRNLKSKLGVLLLCTFCKI